MEYTAGIRALGEKDYLEKGSCEQSQFVHWIKRAAWWGRRLKKKCLVDFAQKPHTFEVDYVSGETHLLTPEQSIIDPALAAQFEGG